MRLDHVGGPTGEEDVPGRVADASRRAAELGADGGQERVPRQAGGDAGDGGVRVRFVQYPRQVGRLPPDYPGRLPGGLRVTAPEA